MDEDITYTEEDVETAVYEFIAASLLDVLPEEKLEELDHALAGTDEEFDIFLSRNIPDVNAVLQSMCEDFALPKDVCREVIG